MANILSPSTNLETYKGALIPIRRKGVSGIIWIPVYDLKRSDTILNVKSFKKKIFKAKNTLEAISYAYATNFKSIVSIHSDFISDGIAAIDTKTDQAVLIELTQNETFESLLIVTPPFLVTTPVGFTAAAAQTILYLLEMRAYLQKRENTEESFFLKEELLSLFLFHKVFCTKAAMYLANGLQKLKDNEIIRIVDRRVSILPEALESPKRFTFLTEEEEFIFKNQSD